MTFVWTNQTVALLLHIFVTHNKPLSIFAFLYFTAMTLILCNSVFHSNMYSNYALAYATYEFTCETLDSDIN